VVAVKKALCFFLAIVFVCCVITHGKNERFSIEVFLNNITNFEDMPTMEDIVSVWQDPFYVERVDLPNWIDVYIYTGSEGKFTYLGYYAIGREHDGGITTRYSYEWLDVYNENGEYVGNLPIVSTMDTVVFYENPYAEGIEKAFNKVIGFFRRLSRTVGLIIELIKVVFSNMRYLLPWNSTVPKGV
jgi:hypothetical protein